MKQTKIVDSSSDSEKIHTAVKECLLAYETEADGKAVWDYLMQKLVSPMKFALIQHTALFDIKILDRLYIELLNDLHDLKPFIFNDRHEFSKIIPFIKEKFEAIEEKGVLTLPFRSCSFEVSNSEISVQLVDGVPTWVLCKFFIEKMPGNITTHDFTIQLLPNQGGLGYRLFTSDADDDPTQINTIHKNVRLFNLSLAQSKIGLEKTNFQFKKIKDPRLGKVGGCPIKLFVHLARKDQVTPPVGYLNRRVEWSHRWFVMGHWRKFEGLGKNREGGRDVEGYTWVTEHTKGPTEAPLVNKVRMMHGGKSHETNS
jgi:hypothetical protein